MNKLWQRPACLALCCAVAGCRATAHVGAGMNVSSETSEYSPMIRLAVRTPIVTDSLAREGTAIVVRVDSSVVTAHGSPAPGALVAMKELRISALLAAFPKAGAQPGSLAHPWRELARSEDQHLADSLRYGERSSVPSMTFVIPVRKNELKTANSVVFEITGIAMSTPVRLATGELRTGGMMGKGSIRVFACSIFRLNGSIDKSREISMGIQYVGVC